MSQLPRHPHSQDIPGATPATMRAFFRNQQRWLERLATGQTDPTIPHPRIRHDDSVMTVRTGQSGVMSLNLGDPGSVDDLAAVERSWGWLRAHGQRDLLVWSMVDRPPMTLALLARGFDLSFQPTWMARDLRGTLPDTSLTSALVRVASPHDLDELRVTTAIPYLVPDQLATTRMLALEPEGREVWWLIARDRGGVVGQAIVHMTGNMAGLFNVAVHPRARRRGIGRALTTTAMRLAQELGATVMGLNATPDGMAMYQGLGFRHMGEGMTWFLPSRRSRLVPNPGIVAIAEAIGSGRIGQLRGLPLPARLANGDLPMQFASRFRQAEMVHWLLDSGAEQDVLALWDVGLHEEAVHAMTDTVVLDRPSGPWRATPLHHAVERDDVTLAGLLVSAGADLSMRDTQYRATALEWAEHLDRPEIASIIRNAHRN